MRFIKAERLIASIIADRDRPLCPERGRFAPGRRTVLLVCRVSFGQCGAGYAF